MKKKILMRAQVKAILLLLVFAATGACTKSRKAQLPEEQQASVFAISEFGEISENSAYEAILTSAASSAQGDSTSLQAFETDDNARLFAHEVTVPNKMKFMFDNLPLSNLKNKGFKITFSVDKDYVSAYKITKNVNELSILEKSIALTVKEVRLVSKNKEATVGLVKGFTDEQRAAVIEKNEIKSGQKQGTLLIPLFKYKIQSYGIIVRTKNELKEETSKLEVKRTDWKSATHVQLQAQTDSRMVVGMSVDQVKDLKQVYSESKIDNQVMSAGELQSRLSVAMKFMANETRVYTRLGADSMYVYEITDAGKLTDNQRRLLNNKAGNQQILSCQDENVAAFIKSNDKNCVLVLSALIPVKYKNAKLAEENEIGSTSPRIQLEDVQKVKSVGLVEIKENVAARQLEISTSGILDPNSTVKIADLSGEFFYRRTFESASNMFLGRTGTSGDMSIIRFELEDKRIVVRNQKSLIAYTGQGPKDREEMMSFPVSYFKMAKSDEHGNSLTVPMPVKATKETAEYAMIDWTNNTVPDANSPLAFYSGGGCFMANSALSVTDTDMRLATDGVLNYSLSGSYTVKPTTACLATKDVNSAYWAGSYQFNFNISERISFLKHKDANADIQFSKNISSMAQAAFNFGVFTLADKVTGNGALANRDGSEKYMPIIHDFRNGKVLRYYLGGINNSELTSPERRQLLVEATQQVMNEWNSALKLSFKGTPLERAGKYLELIVDEKDSKGHLGDLDRNYIWLQELPAQNGLLGVAQPAANPRSGTIQSANVIVYTGNTYDQTEALLKITKISREYEKEIEKIKKIKKAAAEKAAAEQKVISTAEEKKDKAVEDAIRSGQVDAPAAVAVKSEVSRMKSLIQNSVKMLQLENAKINAAIKGIKKGKGTGSLRTIMTKDIFDHDSKGQEINYAVDSQTFLKKLADIASKDKASNDPNSFELEVNKAFIQFGGLEETVKQALRKRSQLLDAVVRFDENTKDRPGCFSYARNDINDKAQVLDPDPKKNQMLNFKKNVMSTLSHELGHAFGLLHNFKASIDKANYEFDKNNPTGRNYSSIMDYIADIDINYKGPGPYDVHAVRAAYTGLVENAAGDALISIDDIAKDLKRPLVHFTKDTVNTVGTIRHFEQCDDGGTASSVLCARFDSGGSASEIVQNLIADYHRGYINRNYVHDKIVFDSAQKVQIIKRNITLFQNIRSFLDQAIMSRRIGTGRPEAVGRAQLIDQLKAAKLGYTFFHELIRTPDAKGASIMAKAKKNVPPNTLLVNDERFFAVPYKYKNTENEEISDIRLIEARSTIDVWMSRDKVDTMGMNNDKIFAMMFLLQSTAAQNKDENNNSQISYLDFEQFQMGINDPSESPTMKMILQILQNDLKVGFFAPMSIETKPELTVAEFNAEAQKLQTVNLLEVNVPVSVGYLLAEQTAVGTIIGLAQSKWRSFDPFAESFKISKSSLALAPKDRPNVAKMGQDKSLDDTKVMFASQNAAGSAVLINTAARTEFYILNRGPVFSTPMVQLYMADAEFQKAFGKVNAEVCAATPDEANCQAVVTAKAKADAQAQELIALLREINKSGMLMDPELDTAESPLNFEKQVTIIRSILVSQFGVILKVKSILESTPVEKIDATRNAVVAELAKIKAENAKLESLQLVATAYAVVSEVAASIPIELKNGDKLNGQVIAGLMMNTEKLEEDLKIQLPIIEKLSLLSNVVDPDTSGR